MAAYENFASVYDKLMDDVPYGEWAKFIRNLLTEYGIDDGLVLDLGCGTGKMTKELRDAGYDMIGVDSSVDMLRLARENTPGDILYLNQDMRSFELYGTVRAIVSVCDSLNYITDPEELRTVFRLANNYLDPGGIMIFDINTEYKYRDVIGNGVIAEDREDVSFIWYNEYEEDSRINTIDLSVFFFFFEDLYRKYEEMHIQAGYSRKTIQRLIEGSGMRYLAAYDDYCRLPPHKKSERIVFVAGEQGKTDKNTNKDK